MMSVPPGLTSPSTCLGCCLAAAVSTSRSGSSSEGRKALPKAGAVATRQAHAGNQPAVKVAKSVRDDAAVQAEQQAVWYDLTRALQHVKPRVPAWGFSPLPILKAGFSGISEGPPGQDLSCFMTSV